MLILGIETSCDETAAAVVRADNGQFSVLSNIVSSQVKLHAAWGGVVPNLAAREHLKNILPVIQESLSAAKIKSQDINLIAVTNGPGLIPALLIGTTAAKTLAYLWQKPLIGIQHIEGHISANFLSLSSFSNKKCLAETEGSFHLPFSKGRWPKAGGVCDFPLLCLVVSGGHTQLILMQDFLRYEIIGQTLDDAAGEAFDKVARILNLGYPGGPAIAAQAEKINNNKYKILKEKLPRPMINSQNFNFSFSGLKTAVLYLAKRKEKSLKNKQFICEVCHEFQQAAVDVLISKTISAAKKCAPRTICIAGGVSANKELRAQLEKTLQEKFPAITFLAPDTRYSIDNAAMIAIAGGLRWEKNSQSKSFQKIISENWKNLDTDANLKLT